MARLYTDEKNAQVIIALLKAHGIRKVIASPGTTNMAIVASMQNDSYFEMYSSVDERSAAYMACGLAYESGETVVISCTGATASRNYLPGLTEAYYRKLPILAITSIQAISKVGHHIAQIIDRSILPNDAVRYSVALPIVKDDDDLWDCEIKVNKAILELSRDGGGPVHINLPTTYSRSYTTTELPAYRRIDRIVSSSKFPDLKDGKIAIFIGSHSKIGLEETELIDKFCESNNALVFCDHTSNYKGKFRVLFALAACQQMLDNSIISPDLLIHIGEVSGDYYSLSIGGTEVWRVSEDGEIRDTFRRLRYVFEMREQDFFRYYSNRKKERENTYFKDCKSLLDLLYMKIPELPFSNIWIASRLANQIPEEARLHFGILNSLRAWNFFEVPNSVLCISNVGGFGIDGGVSSLIGSALANRDRLYFGVIGDLAFFYDMNVLGNRHVGNNIRILLINNGKGTEFRHTSHPAAEYGNDADLFMAAGGHFGNKSKVLVKHYAQDLGFEYLKAENKQEFELVCNRFIMSNMTDKPILFEVFTDSEDESIALEKMVYLEQTLKGQTMKVAKQVIGKKNVDFLKKVLGK
jgi:2-succinyl-5-enolpyruvyl-6-hydroxy-3-cyclohexene-1-carboxylate synthase